MARTDPPTALCDAGPIIHLDQLDSLDLLRGFQAILVCPTVLSEVTRHRPGVEIATIPGAQVVRPSAVPSPNLASIAEAFSLDAGEREALLLTETHRVGLFLTDDAAARLAAEALRLEVHGTLGVLVRAIRMKFRSREEVLDLLTRLPGQSTLHISRHLLQGVIARVKADR